MDWPVLTRARPVLIQDGSLSGAPAIAHVDRIEMAAPPEQPVCPYCTMRIDPFAGTIVEGVMVHQACASLLPEPHFVPGQLVRTVRSEYSTRRGVLMESRIDSYFRVVICRVRLSDNIDVWLEESEVELDVPPRAFAFAL